MVGKLLVRLEIRDSEKAKVSIAVLGSLAISSIRIVVHVSEAGMLWCRLGIRIVSLVSLGVFSWRLKDSGAIMAS